MSASRWVVAVALLATVACGATPAAERHTKDVVADLEARAYGAASSRYRMFESEVLAPEAAPAWRHVIEHADATVREWAVDALSRIGMAEDVDLVAARLDDPVRGVRVAATSGLIRMQREAAIEEFTARIAASAPEQVTLAASGFAELEYTDGVALVVRRLQDPQLPESTRAALTQPLAALGGAPAVRALTAIALDAQLGAELRRLAAEAAFAAQADGVEDELRRLLDADDEYVRSLAATMLPSAR
jgi:HEAT repeat protein